MDEQTRREYLAAMGIDVWLPRFEPAKPQSAAPEDSWEQLQAEVEQCSRCDLCQSRNNVVHGVGHRPADVLWITESPNAEEEQQAAPLMDKTAALFDEILRAMQLTRESVFITHITKCRPVEDKDPKSGELLACREFLAREIALVQPKVIIALGRVAAQSLLESKVKVSELRQAHYDYLGIPLFVTYHPAYLLRKLSEKPQVWQDLQPVCTLLSADLSV